MAISRSEARRLAKNGVEMGARVLRGTLTIGPDGAKINGTDVTTWLSQYADLEFVLVAAPVGKSYIESEVKTCYTCGRDYKGSTCPRCAEARARLRG